MRCWRYRALQGAARRGTALRGSPPHAVLALHGVSRHCTASARHCPGLPRATQGCVALHTLRCWCARRCTSLRSVALRCSARDVGALQGVPRRGAVQRGQAGPGAAWCFPVLQCVARVARHCTALHGIAQPRTLMISHRVRFSAPCEWALNGYRTVGTKLPMTP